MTGSILWTPTSGFRRSLPPRSRTRCRRLPCAAFAHRFRLVFQGTWIRHCGWYTGSWIVQLMDRRYAKYDGSLVGERVVRRRGQFTGLANDIVDDDLKGLARLAAQARALRGTGSSAPRPAAAVAPPRADAEIPGNARPLTRAVLKDVIFPSVPAKPVALFVYMYFVRLGLLDGRAGLRFCFYLRLVRGQRGRTAGRSRRSRVKGNSMEARLARRAVGDVLSVCQAILPCYRGALDGIARVAPSRVRKIPLPEPGGPGLGARRGPLPDLDGSAGLACPPPTLPGLARCSAVMYISVLD